MAIEKARKDDKSVAEYGDENVAKILSDRVYHKRKMLWLRRTAGDKVIPPGCYCYTGDSICQYWDKFIERDEVRTGFCWYMEKGAWEKNMSELDNQVKQCNKNKETKNDKR